MTHILSRLRFLFAGIVVVLGLVSTSAMAAHIINIEIVSAPVVANGNVAHEPTEFNLLVGSADPEVFGLQIPAGGRMEVELGGSYIPNPDFAGFLTGGNGFLPARNIILTTGPQNPIKPNTEAVSGGFWRVESPNVNTMVVVPRCTPGLNCDNFPGGLNGTRAGTIGFKVIHVRPNDRNRQHSQVPFYNGGPGSTGTVDVRIFDDGGTMIASGSQSIVFQTSVGPQVHPTNVLTRDDNSNVSLTNFQRVSKNTHLTDTGLPNSGTFTNGGPYAAQFYLFENFGEHDPEQFPTGLDLPGIGDTSFIPFPGFADLTVKNTNDPSVARLMSGDSQIGTASINGPAFDGKGNNSRSLIKGNQATVVHRGNGTVLFLPVKVGRAAGEYHVTVTLDDGNSTTQTVVVE